jgi:hypothetical protein
MRDLSSNHKPKKLAVITEMRKLLLIAHVVHTNGDAYREAT